MLNQAGIPAKLLASISEQEFQRLTASAIVVQLDKDLELAAPWKSLHHCWFPLSGIVSSLTSDADGEEAAVCLIGKEGLVDAATILGHDICSTRMVVQVAGTAVRVTRSALADQIERSPNLSRLLLAYVRFKSIQPEAIMLSAIRRPLRSRLSAFLLMWFDRAEATDIGTTHEDLAIMLGMRRAGVTTALRALAVEGAVKTGRRESGSAIEDCSKLRSANRGDAEAAYARLIGNAGQ